MLFPMLLLAIVLLVYRLIFPGYQACISGKLYTLNKLSRSISVFDLSTGRTAALIQLQEEAHEMILLPDNKRLVLANYGNEIEYGASLTVVDTEKDSVAYHINLDACSKPHGIVAYGQDAKVLVVDDVGNQLYLVDIDRQTIEHQMSTQQCKSHHIALHPHNNQCFVSNIVAQSVSRINLDSFRVDQIIDLGKDCMGLALTPDGQQLWVCHHQDNCVSVIRGNKWDNIGQLATGQQPLRVQFTHNGQLALIVNRMSGTINIYEVATQKRLNDIKIAGNGHLIDRLTHHTPRLVSVLIHPSDSFAFVANSNANRVEVIDMHNKTHLTSIPTQQIPDCMVLSINNDVAKYN